MLSRTPSDQIRRSTAKRKKSKSSSYKPTRSRSRSPKKEAKLFRFTEDGNDSYDFLQYLTRHNRPDSDKTNDSLYRKYLKERKIAKRGDVFTYAPTGQEDRFSMRLMLVNGRLVWRHIDYVID
jgi:hypothetical protein